MSTGAGGAARGPALTARGRAALACGLAALGYARLFGAREIALLGAVLVAAAVLARIWVGRSGGAHVALRSLPAFAHAGERLRVAVELRPLAGARGGRAAFVETATGDACALRPVTSGGLRVLRGSYELGPLVRGVCELAAGELVREDPFGLARRVDTTRGSTAVTVLARPLQLSERGQASPGETAFAGRRLRGGGHELHGVREHQPGEPLRGVHWPATAHRGRLMVKELDDPAGDDLLVVLDARAASEVGTAPDSSFELAVSAAEALVARAETEQRRVRLVVAGAAGEPASASERLALRRLLARVRPGGERSLSEALGRRPAGRAEVITSRPRSLVGLARAGQLGVIAIDPSSFDPAVARDDGALEALRAAGAHVREVRRPERAEAPPAPARSRRAAPVHGALYALAVAFALLHVRDLQSPPLGTASLAAIALLATAPALLALRAGRRLGLLALAPAGLAAAWVASGHWPSPGAPLGGLGGRLLDAPSAWVRVVLPFTPGGQPALHTGALALLFAWLGALSWVWLVRPRPFLAALLAVLPFALSATVYDLPQYPWRALAAAVLLLAFLRTGRAAGGTALVAAAFAALALSAGVAWAAVPAASGPPVLPWTTWTFSHDGADPIGVDITWDMRYQPLTYAAHPVEVLQVRAARPSYWRALVLTQFDGLRFEQAPQIVVAAGRSGGVLRVPAPPAGPRLRAEVRVAALEESALIAPGQPVRYEVPADAGAVVLGTDASAELRGTSFPGLSYVAEGSDPDPTAAALSALPARYPAAVAGAGLSFAGVAIPAFGAPGREAEMAALFRAHAADPVWRAWRVAYARARVVTRGAASPYQAVVALEAWLRTSRTYDPNASLPETPDALARWAASGQVGHCQMFSAALAALARLSGVPARVAEGFVPGQRSDGVFHVTDRDAHAWVEAWFPGFGWLPFDATPGSSLPQRASSSSLAFDGRAAQATPSGGGRATSLPRFQLPLLRLRALLGTGGGARSASTGAGASRLARPALTLALLVALLAGLLLLKRTLLRLFLPRSAAGAARGRVEAFAADQGLRLGAALTPRELAAALGQRFGVEAGPFAAELERAAYSAPRERDDAGLAAATAGLLRALRGALGPAQRLRGAWSLRGISAARGRAR